MSKVYLHYATGAFSLWSKDAGVFNQSGGWKRGVEREILSTKCVSDIIMLILPLPTSAVG